MPSIETTPLSYTLPAILSIETAGSVAEALRQLSPAPHACFTLDASAVESLTAPGAQILVSFHKNMTAAQGELAITGYKPFFSQALNDLGLGWLIAPSKNTGV